LINLTLIGIITNNKFQSELTAAHNPKIYQTYSNAFEPFKSTFENDDNSKAKLINLFENLQNEYSKIQKDADILKLITENKITLNTSKENLAALGQKYSTLILQKLQNANKILNEFTLEQRRLLLSGCINYEYQLSITGTSVHAAQKGGKKKNARVAQRGGSRWDAAWFMLYGVGGIACGVIILPFIPPIGISFLFRGLVLICLGIKELVYPSIGGRARPGPKSTGRKEKIDGRERIIYEGPRGGRYIMKAGKYVRI